MKRLILLMVLMPACIFADDEPQPVIPNVEYEGHVVDLNEVKLLANATITFKIDASAVQVEGALSQYNNKTLTLQTSTAPVTIEAEDATWTIDVAQNAQRQVKHHCGSKSIYETGKSIELGLSLTEGNVEVLGPIETPSVEGSNLSVSPVASRRGRQLMLASFLNPENGSLIIGETDVILLEVVQRARIERVEVTKLDGDLYAVRFIERGAAFCHTPKDLELEGCELVSKPNAKQPTHTFKKTKSTCQLTINGDVIGSF